MSAPFSLTVLSKPSCVQCTSTYRAMDRKDLPHTSVDITLPEGADFYDKAKALGYMQAPVVLAMNADGEIIDHWSGFRPDKVDEFAALHKASAETLELAAA